MKAIKTEKLTRRFGERVAVDELNLEVESGEFFALLGLNGAGKTTSIRMLSCLLSPSSGDALVLGKSIVAETAEVKQRINLSPQETAIAPNLSVRENLELIAGIYGASRSEAHSKAAQSMETFGLSQRAEDRAKTLSGGMQRRLSIAMALITEPELVFLDEPTLGLDVRARRELWEVLERLRGSVTIILTTHYMEEADALADRIAVMDEGRICALGTAEELKAATKTASLEEAFLALTDKEVVA